MTVAAIFSVLVLSQIVMLVHWARDQDDISRSKPRPFEFRGSAPATGAAIELLEQFAGERPLAVKAMGEH